MCDVTACQEEREREGEKEELEGKMRKVSKL
jgi:hypothetical protein